MNLLFTDIDGTLLRSDNTISENLRAGLQALSDHGHGFVLSSGRPLMSTIGVIDCIHVNFKHLYVIANNGSLVYDYNQKKPILDIRFPFELVNPIQEMATEHNLHIQTYTQEAVVSPTLDEEVKSYIAKVHIPAIASERLLDALTEAPYKMLAISLTDHASLVRFQNHVMQRYSDQLTTMFSNEYYLELINKKASKGNALTFLCDYLNVPIENSYAVGDSYNDIPMLQAAGTSYAMQNASQDIKNSAAFTTALDHNHDGILEILSKHF